MHFLCVHLTDHCPWSLQNSYVKGSACLFIMVFYDPNYNHENSWCVGVLQFDGAMCST